MKGKGRCFELAAQYQWENPTWTLVHGYVRMNALPLLKAHAWLEKRGRVFDPTNKDEPRMSVRRYRGLYQARAEQRYSAKQAGRLILKHEHYGPWGEVCRHDILNPHLATLVRILARATVADAKREKL